MGKVVFYLLVVLSLSVACDKEEEEVKKSKEAKILKWQFGDKEATISGTDIEVYNLYQITLEKLRNRI